jgi:CRP/FNR family transcriptional regulator, cyclic AMP receptor protein
LCYEERMTTADSASRLRKASPAPPTVEELREIGLFGALCDEVLAHLTGTLETRWVQSGEIIFREGDAAHDMFVVLEGEIEVLKQSREKHDHRVAILGPKDSCGEMSLIDVQPRSATVRCLAPSRLLRVTSEDFDRLYRYDLKSYALVTLNIARDLSRRLRVADGILADFTAHVLDHYVKPRL